MDKFIIYLLGLYGIVMLLMCILQYYTVFLNNKKSINQVHFYVARDKTHNLLWLYLGKPIRFKDDAWIHGKHGTVINSESSFEILGLNKEDYNSIKWEDEPVEVFLNMED